MRSPTPDGQPPAADDRRDPPTGPVPGMGTDQEAIGLDLPRHDDPPLRPAPREPEPEPDDIGTRPTERLDVGNRPTVRLPRQRQAPGTHAPLLVAGPVAALFAPVASILP